LIAKIRANFLQTTCLAIIHAFYISLPLAMAPVAVSFTGNYFHAFLISRKIVAVLPVSTSFRRRPGQFNEH